MKHLIKTLLVLLFLIPLVTASINNLNLCDKGTERMRDFATVCSGSNVYTPDTTLGPAVIQSVESLRTAAKKPFYVPSEGVTFLYFEPEPDQPKEVKIILTKNIDTGKIEFGLGPFVNNLLNGEGIIFTLDGEFYLLTYPQEEETAIGEAPEEEREPTLEEMFGEGAQQEEEEQEEEPEELFSPEKLLLRHIPTQPKIGTHPSPYPGSNWFLFEVFNQKKIAVGVYGDKFVVSALRPGETPAAYPTPYNLKKQYEVSFTLMSPARITTPDVGTFSICQGDNPRNPQLVEVCNTRADSDLENVFVTLQKDRLTEKGNYLFLYTYENNVKKVSLFTMEDGLKDSTEAEGKVVKLKYDDFIDGLVEGRKYGFKFLNNYYLISHSGRDVLSLPRLTLKAYNPEGVLTAETSFSGTESFVEASTLDGGRVYIKQLYGQPPPDFRFWVLEQHEVKPVDLVNEFSGTITSLSPLTLTDAGFGTVSVKSDDIRFSSTLFKLQKTGTGVFNIDLSFREPKAVDDQVDDHTLFYYHTANVENNVPVKTASVYLYYTLKPEITDLNQVPSRQDFNDAFIATLTSGKEFALNFPKDGTANYYLLGHPNQQGQRVFFDLSRLTLKNLDRTQTFTSTVEGNKAIFVVPEGRITIETDDTTNKIYFKSSAIGKSTVKFKEEDYSIIITPTNRVEVGSTILEMCDLSIYEEVPAANICYGLDKHFLVENAAGLRLNNKRYLLEVNGEVGDSKQVKLHRIIEINEQQRTLELDDWGKFTQHIAAVDLPVFNISNKLYLPAANNNLLSNFAFVKYPVSAPFTIRDWRAITPITSNGSYVLEEKVIFVKQELTGSAGQQKVKAQMELKNYAYLPDDQSELLTGYGISELPASKRFITNLRGEKYNLRLNGVARDKLVLVEVWQEDAPQAESVKINRYFAQGETKTLVLDGIQVEIKVAEIKESTAKVSVKRSS